MRIALDATPLLAPHTGVGVFVKGLLTALPSIACCDDVRGYALTSRGHRQLDRLLPARVTKIGRPVPARLVRQTWRRFDHPTAATMLGRADVVHGTNYVVPPARRALEVLTVHDLTFVHYPEMCEPVILELPGLIRRAINRGAVVHTPSRFMADEVCDWLSIGSDRVFTVAHGLDRPALEPGGDAKQPVGGRRYVVAVGTVEPRKDLPGLVAAFDLIADDHPDVDLVIAGPDGWGAEALSGAIALSPWPGRIRRLGWVSDAQRRALLAGATVMAYPSRYEGFGFPPLEALAVGTPVVATTAGSLPEVLGDTARLVPPGDVDALARALSVVLSGQAGQVGDDARQWVAGYTWERCATEMRANYARLIANR